MTHRELALLVIAAIIFATGCSRKPPTAPEAPAGLEEVRQLQTLGRHFEAESVAIEFGIAIEPDEWIPIESFKETSDGGDDPLVPGCVCCYSDNACTVIQGRSVDECFPGGDGGDDLSESIAPTTCTQGGTCAKRKAYSCDRVLPGSVCRLREMSCCGVATTSAYCYLDIT